MDEIRTSSTVSNRGRIITGRLCPGTDLIAGIEKICRDNSLQYGVVTSAIGSFSMVRFVYVQKDDSARIGIKYAEPTEINEPLELLTCQGMVGTDDDGELSIHLHGVMVDSGLKMIGGHFVKGGNIVLATVEVSILELNDTELIRRYDDETGFPLFNFKQK